jgi:hypothetical protein
MTLALLLRGRSYISPPPTLESGQVITLAEVTLSKKSTLPEQKQTNQTKKKEGNMASPGVFCFVFSLIWVFVVACSPNLATIL